jgi:hypothetical protein
MNYYNNDVIAIYSTSKRLTLSFIEKFKAEVERELPGIQFHAAVTDDMIDNVEVEVEGTETEEAFEDMKADIGNRILAIADRLWETEDKTRAATS